LNDAGGQVFLFGQVFDLFAVEEEQVGDAEGQDGFDVFVPALGEVVGEFTIAADFEGVAAIFGQGLPGAAQGKGGGLGLVVQEGEFELGGGGGGVAVDALVEKGVVSAIAPGGALGAGTIEDEAQGIHEGGFAAAVEAADEDDGLAIGGEQGQGLPSAIGAKVLQNEFFENQETASTEVEK